MKSISHTKVLTDIRQAGTCLNKCYFEIVNSKYLELSHLHVAPPRPSFATYLLMIK